MGSLGSLSGRLGGASIKRHQRALIVTVREQGSHCCCCCCFIKTSSRYLCCCSVCLCSCCSAQWECTHASVTVEVLAPWENLRLTGKRMALSPPLQQARVLSVNFLEAALQRLMLQCPRLALALLLQREGGAVCCCGNFHCPLPRIRVQVEERVAVIDRHLPANQELLHIGSAVGMVSALNGTASWRAAGRFRA